MKALIEEIEEYYNQPLLELAKANDDLIKQDIIRIIKKHQVTAEQLYYAHRKAHYTLPEKYRWEEQPEAEKARWETMTMELSK